MPAHPVYIHLAVHTSLFVTSQLLIMTPNCGRSNSPLMHFSLMTLSWLDSSASDSRQTFIELWFLFLSFFSFCLEWQTEVLFVICHRDESAENCQENEILFWWKLNRFFLHFILSFIRLELDNDIQSQVTSSKNWQKFPVVLFSAKNEWIKEWMKRETLNQRLIFIALSNDTLT